MKLQIVQPESGLDPSVKNINKEYANKHKYTYKSFRPTPNTSFLQHILDIINDNPKTMYFLWMNSNTMVIDSDVKLDAYTSYLKSYHSKHRIALCKSSTSSNTDVILFKQNPWTKAFLKTWIQGVHSKSNESNELKRMQDIDLLKSNSHIVTFPPSAFNSNHPSNTFIRNYSKNWTLKSDALTTDAIQMSHNMKVNLTPQEHAIQQMNIDPNGPKKCLIILVYGKENYPYGTLADTLVRKTASRTDGMDVVSISSDSTTAFLYAHEIGKAKAGTYEYFAILSPGTTFASDRPVFYLPHTVNAASVPGMILFKGPPRFDVQITRDRTDLLPALNLTQHTSGLRQQVERILEGIKSTPKSLQDTDLPPNFFVVAQETKEQKTLEGRIWMGVAISALVVVFVSGLVLRYGPVIHFKQEDPALNGEGIHKTKW